MDFYNHFHLLFNYTVVHTLPSSLFSPLSSFTDSSELTQQTMIQFFQSFSTSQQNWLFFSSKNIISIIFFYIYYILCVYQYLALNIYIQDKLFLIQSTNACFEIINVLFTNFIINVAHKIVINIDLNNLLNSLYINFVTNIQSVRWIVYPSYNSIEQHLLNEISLIKNHLASSSPLNVTHCLLFPYVEDFITLSSTLNPLGSIQIYHACSNLQDIEETDDILYNHYKKYIIEPIYKLKSLIHTTLKIYWGIYIPNKSSKLHKSYNAQYCVYDQYSQHYFLVVDY